MIVEQVLVIRQNGTCRALKGSSGTFHVDRDEVAIRVQVEVPDEVFEDRPIPLVVIKPDSSHFMRPVTVEIDPPKEATNED